MGIDFNQRGLDLIWHFTPPTLQFVESPPFPSEHCLSEQHSLRSSSRAAKCVMDRGVQATTSVVSVKMKLRQNRYKHRPADFQRGSRKFRFGKRSEIHGLFLIEDGQGLRLLYHSFRNILLRAIKPAAPTPAECHSSKRRPFVLPRLPLPCNLSTPSPLLPPFIVQSGSPLPPVASERVAAQEHKIRAGTRCNDCSILAGAGRAVAAAPTAANSFAVVKAETGLASVSVAVSQTGGDVAEVIVGGSGTGKVRRDHRWPVAPRAVERAVEYYSSMPPSSSGRLTAERRM